MNLHNIINEIEKVDSEVYDRLDGRRAAIRKLTSFTGKVALSAVPVALGSLFQKAYGQTGSAQIVDVLNFALTLEYLEAEFYNIGVATPNLIPAGPARGAMTTIRDHENQHVQFLIKTITELGQNLQISLRLILLLRIISLMCLPTMTHFWQYLNL